MNIKVGSTIMEEWAHIWKDKRLMAILFLVPLMYSALFGFIYTQHKVTEMKTIVMDEDQSSLSRQIIQAFEESETFRITSTAHSEREVEQALASGDAVVGLFIPNRFEAGIQSGQTLPILTWIDGSNMIYANAATKGANEVIASFSAGASLKKLQLQEGLRQEQVMNMLSPIPYRYRVMYNSTFNYSDFMMYGLMGAILQQVLFLGIALSITREKDAGRWGRFAVWEKTPWRLAYAKTAPYFAITLFNATTMLLLTSYLFQIPIRGHVSAGLLLVASFSVAVCGIGYFISLISGNQLGATQIAMLIAVPSFLLSGFTWPFEAMPQALVTFGKLLPLTYLLDGVRSVFVKGNGLEWIAYDCVALLTMGLAAYLAGFLWTRFLSFRPYRNKQAAEVPESESGRSGAQRSNALTM